MSKFDEVKKAKLTELWNSAIIRQEKIGYCKNWNLIPDPTKALLYADTSAIKFYTDIDNDGDVDSIHYYLGPTSELSSTANPRDRMLYRQVNSDLPFIISNNITEFKFQYLGALYDTLSTPLASPGLATYIKISFRVEDPFAYDEKYTEAFWRRLTVTSKNLKRN